MSVHDIITAAMSGTALALSVWNLARLRRARREQGRLSEALWKDAAEFARLSNRGRRPIPGGVKPSEAFEAIVRRAEASCAKPLASRIALPRLVGERAPELFRSDFKGLQNRTEPEGSNKTSQADVTRFRGSFRRILTRLRAWFQADKTASEVLPETEGGPLA